MTAGSHVLARNLPFADVTSYKPVAAGSWQVHASGGNEKTSKTVSLAAPGASAASGTGWLRLAHLSPNTPAVDVYLYSFGDSSAMVVLKHVTYGTVSGYEKVASGEYTVAMRGAGAASGSKPVLSTTMTAGSHVLARNLPFADVTSYKPVAAGSWQVHASGGNEKTSKTVSLAARSIHTIVILDDPGHLMIDNLTDAVGSATTPLGAPKTGLGGTAPRPGASLLPWLAIVSGGLLITGASVIRRRQTRTGAIRVR